MSLPTSSRRDAIAQAKAEPAVQEALAGKTIVKEIYVKGQAGQPGCQGLSGF